MVAGADGFPGRVPSEGTPVRRIAYFTSEYPKVSHSFIRREIHALEGLGWEVLRFSVRGWNSVLVDAGDIAERGRTSFILKAGGSGLVAAVLRSFFRSPSRFVAALATSFRFARTSDKPLPWHLIYFAEACWLAQRLLEQEIPHLHTHFATNPGDVALLVKLLTGITYSLTIHGPEEFDRAWAIHLAEKVRNAQFAVAISSFGRSQILRLLPPTFWDKIHVIRCAVDEEFAALDREPAPGGNKLVCVGRLCEQKGQLLLVRALTRLASEHPDFKMVFVGDGEDRPRLSALIEELGLGGVIEIIGWASSARVKQEILESRALVLPSFAEGLPIVLLEAMLLGRPVISTYVAGIPELVVNGVTGWLVPAGSEEDLEGAIRLCLETAQDRLAQMGKAGRDRVLRRHSIAMQAELLDALFLQIARTKLSGVDRMERTS